MRKGHRAMHVVGTILALSLAAAAAAGEASTLKGQPPSGASRDDAYDGAMTKKHHLVHQLRKRPRKSKSSKKGKSGKSSKGGKSSKSKSKKKQKKTGGRDKKGNKRPGPGAQRPSEGRPANKPQRPADGPSPPAPAPANKPADDVPADEREPPLAGCFSSETYDDIDHDIEQLAKDIDNDEDRSHFFGGIVRLAAHDYMDYDPDNPPDKRMGADGCIDIDHPSNDGLDTIWGSKTSLKKLYDERYPHLSVADFWVAAAQVVIKQTSIDNKLDMKKGFLWGRKDREVCRGSGRRLPEATGCDEVEDVFLKRMGMDWVDAVALMGGHTLGRGDKKFSGHHGTWVEDDEEAQVFDNEYYKVMFTESWRPRNMGRDKQDWTTGRGRGNERMMLNTDMCLVFDIEEHVKRKQPCCTRTNVRYPDGQDECIDQEAARMRCPMYNQHDSRREATVAVREMMGGSVSSKNNAPFYAHFHKAWHKATTVGQDNLHELC